MKLKCLIAIGFAASALWSAGCAAPAVEPQPETTVADQSDPIAKDIVIEKFDLSADRAVWVFHHKDPTKAGDRVVALVDKASGKPLATALETADTTYPVQTKIAGQNGTIAGFPRGADVLDAGALLNEAWTQAGKPTALDFRKQMASDGCTMSPDGWWGSCCDAHDACYDSCGGRSSCDSKFYGCMDAMTGGSLTNIAETYYVAVRTFGWMHYDC